MEAEEKDDPMIKERERQQHIEREGNDVHCQEEGEQAAARMRLYRERQKLANQTAARMRLYRERQKLANQTAARMRLYRERQKLANQTAARMGLYRERQKLANQTAARMRLYRERQKLAKQAAAENTQDVQAHPSPKRESRLHKRKVESLILPRVTGQTK